MLAHAIRFETRDKINQAISFLVDQGVLLDDVDVELSKIGAVDLDLYVACLQEMAAKLQTANKVA